MSATLAVSRVLATWIPLLSCPIQILIINNVVQKMVKFLGWVNK